MREITLTSRQLGDWLAKRGLSLKDEFWHLLNVTCQEQNVFDYAFVITDVPWRGALRLQASFAQHKKLQSKGWSVFHNPSKKGDEILVTDVIIDAIISNARYLKRPSHWLTPHFEHQQYGVRIIYPTLVELNKTWNSLLEIAPKINAMVATMTIQLEQELCK